MNLEALALALSRLFARAAIALQRLVAESLRAMESADPRDPAQMLTAAYGGAEDTSRELLVVIEVFVSRERVPERVYAEENPEPDARQAVVRDLLVGEITERLAAAARDMSDEAKRQLREIARRRLEAVSLGEEGLGDGAEEFRRELMERGIRVRDRAGRSQDPESYAYLVLLNGLRDLKNAGTIDAAKSGGAVGVRVSDGDGEDTDEPCVRAHGELWSLTYAMRNRLEHPNCQRQFHPLSPSWEGQLDRE